MKHEIFSTSIWQINGAPQQLVDELYQGAYSCREQMKSNSVSNLGGYQSYALEFKDFHPQGIEYINKILGDIFKEFIVQSWWYNINSKGDSNTAHSHPASDYALVWYLTDSDDKLILMNPLKSQRFLCHDVIPSCFKGDVLIFPADIIHYVLPNDKEDDRISISMNISLRDLALYTKYGGDRESSITYS